ncbi:sulfatase [Planctomycetaceae bacterium SCGC AG-212-F19]|nr:sulfatase [Planctomycetaceae bacterium SCGC AG-212-F19]
MDPRIEHKLHITRRHFLRDGSLGLGAAAVGLLAKPQAAGAAEDKPFAVKPPHFAPKVKNVIYLHMAGSPPHLDMFDYKPELVKRTGENCPDAFLKGKRFAFTSGVPKLLGTPQKFAQHGKSGAWVSEACPKIAGVADELCFVKSMFTDQFNHAPAELLLYTGSPNFGRPSMGSWVTYGLGSASSNLPGFIVLVSSGTNPSAGNANWSSGFLPSVYQGVQCRTDGEPVLYVTNPKGMDRDLRRLSLDALKDLNEQQAAELGNPETRTRIAQYEMAFRMQSAVPEVMDISREPQHVLDLYGAKPGGSSFNNNVLLARRLVEQGVRFVQLHDWGWDFHGTGAGEDIRDGLRNKCKGMDQATAALITDLKARGMLDETLVVWGGEFGRTPFREGRTAASAQLGRDHHPHCFTLFLAGGGVKPGITYGASDELGFEVAENKVHVHDLQTTILHLLGLDHLRLTYRFSGRDFRLTDVFGHLVKDILV